MTALNLITDSLEEHRLNEWYFKRFERDNPVLAPLVVGYLDGGPRPTDEQLGANHYALGLVLAEDARRLLVVPPPDPEPEPDLPTKKLQRFTDLTRVWNKTQAQYPGQQAQEPLSTGTAWPKGGGIFEVPRGFKLVLTPEMIYPGPADSRLVRIAWGDPFNPFGDHWLTGKTTRIQWVDIFPSGQNFEDDHTAPALWEFPVGPSVGHNFTRQGDGRFRFQRQNAPGKSWAVYAGPQCTWDEEHSHVFEIRWSQGSDGYIALSTNGQPWVSYSGPTIMASSEQPWVTYWHMRAALDSSRINTRYLLDWSLYEVAPRFALLDRIEEDVIEPVDYVTEAYPEFEDYSESERAAP